MAILIDINGTDDFELGTDASLNYGLDDDWIAGLDGADAIFTGAGNDVLDGGIGDDTLSGGVGDDIIVAGAGDDTLYADRGNDTYYGGFGSDWLFFYEIDKLSLFDPSPNAIGVKVDLAITGPQNVGVFGIDRYLGFENIGGSLGNDTLYGTADANFMYGFDGNDLLSGRAGNDALSGGSGADTLIGGTGADAIYAGVLDGARDTIRYLTLNDSGVGVQNRDTVDDFTHLQDRIDLRAIDADPTLAGKQALTLVKAFTGAFGEVHLKYDHGNTLVQVNGDRDAAVDMEILVFGVKLTAVDLLL